MLSTLRLRTEERQAERRRRILSAIAHGEASGATIARRARLWTATLYPILTKLEKDGVLTSRWQDRTTAGRGEPRERLYRAVRPDCGPWG